MPSLPSILTALLPRYTPSTLPPTLLTLAESLVAQSRQRASLLKAEEEIARAHACCEIACNRLRAKLRLPVVKEGTAPTKPAVYKRLIGFLDGILKEDGARGAKSGDEQTPKSGLLKRKRSGNTGSAVKNGVAVSDAEEPSTPSKSARAKNTFLGKIRASSSAQRKNAATEEGGKGDENAPSYTMPLIRTLCRTFSTPSLAPHVYTGVCIALKLEGLWPSDELSTTTTSMVPKGKVTGLVIALYIQTLTRAHFAGKLKVAKYEAICRRAVDVLEHKAGVKDVAGWIRTINRNAYARGQEWFGNVPEGARDVDVDGTGVAEGEDGEGDTEEVEAEDVETDEDDDDILISNRRRLRHVKANNDLDEDEDDTDGILRPGLHTMMQESLDFLSDGRTQEFEKWKKQFLLKLDRLDKAQPPAVTAAAGKGGRKAVAVI